MIYMNDDKRKKKIKFEEEEEENYLFKKKSLSQHLKTHKIERIIRFIDKNKKKNLIIINPYNNNVC